MKDSARIFAARPASLRKGQGGAGFFLAHGVTVALQVLVLSVEVRILMGQQVKTQGARHKLKEFPAQICALPFTPWIFITALWYNGSTSDSGSECQGSNPCRATNLLVLKSGIGRFFSSRYLPL